MRGAIGPRARFGLLVLLVLVVQSALGPRLVVAGASADVVLLLAVAAGIVGGPEEGAIAGFVCGLAWDLAVVDTPLGLSALTFALAGFFVGNLQGSVLGATWWTPMASAGLASGAATAVYAVLGVLLGNGAWISAHTVAVVVVVTVVNGLLSPLAIAAVRWAEVGGLPRLPLPGRRGGSGPGGPRRGLRDRLPLPSLPVGRRAPKMGKQPPSLWRAVTRPAGGPRHRAHPGFPSSPRLAP